MRYHVTWRQTVISGKYYSTNFKQKVSRLQRGLVQTLQLFLPYVVFQGCTRETLGKTESQENGRDESNVLLIGHFVN